MQNAESPNQDESDSAEERTPIILAIAISATVGKELGSGDSAAGGEGQSGQPRTPLAMSPLLPCPFAWPSDSVQGWPGLLPTLAHSLTPCQPQWARPRRAETF